MLLYALTIFLSAFLIFQVQPLIAKFILPWFGGTPAVWTTSLLFFQAFLLLGYVYAHVIIRRLKMRMQVIVHISLLVLSLTQLPIIPAEIWRPDATTEPTSRILLLLTLGLGLPYFVLSASAPLLQAWFNRSFPQRSPYRLYALSNVGSLLGLLTYPFLFEPLLTRRVQATIWSVAFGLYCVVCAVVVIVTWRRNWSEEIDTPGDTESMAGCVSWRLRGMWLALSGTAVVLLLAFTNQLTQDIAPIPFLWVMPLSLYLLTFIIAFDRDRWYRREVMIGLAFPAIGGVITVLLLVPAVSLLVQLVTYNVALFVLCLFCHGELARLRPAPSNLTAYYLLIALGGALGGIFVGVLAPAIFDDFLELHLGFVAVLALIVIVVLRYYSRPQSKPLAYVLWGMGGLAMIALIGAMGFELVRDRDYTIARTRNFYGTLAVWEESVGQPDEKRWFLSGAILHGGQFTAEDRRRWPTAYFAEESGVAKALDVYADEPRRIAVVGLGIGTLAAYGQPGDVIRLYEINPEVEDYAWDYFTYLEDSQAEIEVVIGDGRLSLEREEPQNYDLIILDAFSGDSVPVHLLTEEAFAIYLRHLAPDGTIAADITNRHLDLAPVLDALAERYDLQIVQFAHASDDERLVLSAHWMLLTRSDAIVALGGNVAPDENPTTVRLWTDDYTSLFPIMHFR